ncbi:hypothetical protein AJ88_03375 [Mesorhizobium amorphae CCBAU 01583]|nr:hypothetical protein AJ88_03375 [Mesorhizobium amorphae CCBAU 01583]
MLRRPWREPRAAPDLLLDLVEDGGRFAPVEADASGLLLKLQGARQGGQGDRHAVQKPLAVVFRNVAARDAGSSLLGFLLRFDLLPHALGHAGAARFFVAEDMRMAADHLRGDGLDDVAEGEFA